MMMIINRINRINQTNQTNQINQTNQTNQTNIKINTTKIKNPSEPYSPKMTNYYTPHTIIINKLIIIITVKYNRQCSKPFDY